MKPAGHHYDLVIVGGGIVGLATAREFLKRQPGLRLIVLEKEFTIARHQSGHNSGVIHTGIYYTPGSLKAQMCVAGRVAMVDYCRERGIPFKLCGKVIVALGEDELPRLNNLYERGVRNGVPGLELIDPERLHEIEPHVAGIKAIYSPNTGIVDYTQVAQSYAEDVQHAGGEISLGCEVQGIRRGKPAIIQIQCQSQDGAQQVEIEADNIITCGGLYSDKLAQMTGEGAERNAVQIAPFRGDYYTLRPERSHLVCALIYPVPDPQFPFLGVHFTRLPNDEVWAGPNAVLAFAREGYRRADLNLKELWGTFAYPGFRKLVAQYWRYGVHEMYLDYYKAAYLKALQRYLPDLRADDIVPGHSGVRAQALGIDGRLVDDFLIRHDENVIHVQNAPSPAATSSLVIASMIVDQAQPALGQSVR